VAPRKLGIYTLERQLGRGGMGAVYLAFDPTLKRRVAIKILPAHLAADPEYVARFEREATTLAQVRHPNLMHIYAVGEDQGVHFMAMEYIQGRSVAQIIREDGPFALSRAITILCEVTGALDKVHAAGVVHRDLKSGNILIDADGRAVLMDFGLAKPRYDSSVTTEDLLLGTPEYMAPELAEGAGADFRSEVYALGVILYEMLAGKVPFRGSSAIATLRQHVERPLPSIREVRNDLPQQVESLLDRALAKKPEERYPTVSALAADLAPLAGASPTTVTVPMAKQAGAPAETVPTLPADRVAPAPRRRWGLPLALGGGVVGIAIILAVVLWPRTKTNDDTGGGATADAGMSSEMMVRQPGQSPEQIEGRLLSSDGEGGVVRIATGDGVREVPYDAVLRIRQKKGR
jgi:serine/threonine-protein kinase